MCTPTRCCRSAIRWAASGRSAASRSPMWSTRTNGAARCRPRNALSGKGMPMADLISRPLTEIARALRARKASAQELVEQAIARHDRFGVRLHAYLLWTPDQARAAAAAADAAIAVGAIAGPLQGLPISIKDLFAATG